MKVQAKTGTTAARLDDSDSGEGLAIFFSQAKADTVRWRFDVYAKVDTGAELLVGFFYVSPPSVTTPTGEVTRQVGAAVCPGAKSWTVMVSPALGSQAVSNECADINLVSSKCCTAPVGVSRVGERYSYIASDVSPSFHTVLAGQVITRISAHGVGAGTIQIGSAGPLIRVANGADVVLEPKAPIQPGTPITFTLVTYLIEYLESA